MKNKNIFQKVDDYIASQPLAVREMLERIRGIIRSVVPDAEEVISYQIACYKYHGMLVGFGVHKIGCSFYTMNPEIMGSFSNELKEFKYSGATIHFNLQQSLPVALIEGIIKQRMHENEEVALLKKQSKLKKSAKKSVN